MSEHPQPSRWQIVMPLLLVIYLFMIASVLFGGMFDELDDPHTHSYCPEAPIEQAGQIAALVVTGGVLIAGFCWLRRNRHALKGMARDERLIGIILVMLMFATVVRCLAALALAGRVSNSGMWELQILLIQILASIVLIGGGLSLLLRSMQSNDAANDQPGE